MADYWKSMEKKFCDVCKCWITDNKVSVAFHENGSRHKQNIQKRIKDIQKKNKAEEKSDKKMEYDLRKIEQAALAASKKDMEENPDVSMKIQSYYERLKEESGGDVEASSEETSAKKSQPTILHRSDKQKKADETYLADLYKPTKDYQRLSGWESIKERKGDNFLELPSVSSKSPGTSLQLAAKAEEVEPISFAEKTVSSLDPSGSSKRLGIKSEQTEVTFKKRKLTKGNMRRREEDND